MYFLFLIITQHKQTGLIMNLEQIVQHIPECKRILDLSYKNSIKDGVGRKYGELTVKELESYTKAVIRQCKINQNITTFIED
jgi:hypothetical protein